jgi:hypothetical protein
MTNQNAIKFTKDIFDLIKQSKTILDVENIADTVKIPEKNRMKIDGYPKIEFKISSDEIQTLLTENLIDKGLNFATDVTSKLSDPLTKLLYATAWKNGDLKKVKHIIKGVLDSENKDSEQDNALVFYQFGKYLTKKSGQPIIDQHVIRAFAIYNMTDTSQITTLRKMEVLSKKHKITINEYKNWLISDDLTSELRSETDYSYHIDKLLFATGKTIKSRD